MQKESSAFACNSVTSGTVPTTRIEPRSGWQPIDAAELWRFRELLGFLALRDIQVRYKQTFLGATWAILQPVMTMLVFSVLFGLLLGRDGKPTVDGVPYAVSTFCGLLPWQLFAGVFSEAGNSVVSNANLVKKVFFPRLIMPLSTALSALVDFCLALLVLFGMMMWYGIIPRWPIVFLPFLVILAVLAALAGGLWIAALNIQYRDFKYIIPFLVQFGMMISPVVYTSQSVLKDLPASVQFVYFLNPMAGVIEGFRCALLPAATHSSAPPLGAMCVSIAMTLLLLTGGLFYFRRIERSFADLA